MLHDTEKLNLGNQAEEDQLQKHGLEKNFNPLREIDPKTGIEGTTIPDAFKNEGKSTSEIKLVKEQSLTKQLRLQERFSNSHGLKPELIINEEAYLSRPLKHSSFEIKTYNFSPVDNKEAKEGLIQKTSEKNIEKVPDQSFDISSRKANNNTPTL
jgi:Restriction endonuclease fold toxin 7